MGESNKRILAALFGMAHGFAGLESRSKSIGQVGLTAEEIEKRRQEKHAERERRNKERIEKKRRKAEEKQRAKELREQQRDVVSPFEDDEG